MAEAWPAYTAPVPGTEVRSRNASTLGVDVAQAERPASVGSTAMASTAVARRERRDRWERPLGGWGFGSAGGIRLATPPAAGPGGRPPPATALGGGARPP